MRPELNVGRHAPLNRTVAQLLRPVPIDSLNYGNKHDLAGRWRTAGSAAWRAFPARRRTAAVGRKRHFDSLISGHPIRLPYRLSIQVLARPLWRFRHCARTSRYVCSTLRLVAAHPGHAAARRGLAGLSVIDAAITHRRRTYFPSNTTLQVLPPSSDVDQSCRTDASG